MGRGTQQGPGGTRREEGAKRPRDPEKDLPITQCPLYNCKDKQLSEDQKKVVLKWGLCFRCRKERHIARDCKAPPM
jgi:hypothetical protein